MRPLIAWVVWCLAATASAEDLPSALKRPISPGALALLIEHGSEPEAQARLKEALADTRPPVRAAASRVIYAAGIRGLVPDVVRALEAETGPAVSEHLQAIGVLDPVAGEAALFATAARLHDQQYFIGTLLGRAAGVEKIQYLRRLRETGQSELVRYAFVRAAIRHGRADLAGAGSLALSEQDGAAWRAVWEGERKGGQLTEALVLESIRSPSPAIRATTYWFLADKGLLPEGVLKAIEAAPEAAGGDPSNDPALAGVTFAHELFSRARGRAARENLAWLEQAKAALGRPPIRLIGPGAVSVIDKWLTPGERALKPPRPEHLPEPTEPGDVVLSASQGFPQEFVHDISRVTGCLPEKPLAAQAQLEYNALGRPVVVPGGTSPFGAECTVALRLVLRSSYAPDDERAAAGSAKRAVQIFLPDKDEVECPASHGDLQYVGGAIREPKKIKNRPVRYPEGAKARREQGLVILEATINPCGKPVDLRVLKSPALELAQAAIEAVREWRYQPTLLNGQAISVRMTITSKFSLQ